MSETLVTRGGEERTREWEKKKRKRRNEKRMRESVLYSVFMRSEERQNDEEEGIWIFVKRFAF